MLAVSGNQTFVIYIYADNLIQWTSWNRLNIYAIVGYNTTQENISYTVPGSGEEGIVNITYKTNVRRPGMCVFQVHKVESRPVCEDMFRGMSWRKYTKNCILPVCLLTIVFLVFLLS